MVPIDDFREYCTFGEERVYLLLAIARSKENEDISASDQPTIREVVESEAELERKAAQLAHAVSRFDARYRLYLSANARNTTKAFFELRRRMDDWLQMRFNGDDGVLGKFKRVDSEFKSVLQSDSARDETNFVFDIDDATAAEAERLEATLRERTTVRLIQETPNGYHVVTTPFDYTDLEVDIEYELKTDGMIFVSYLDG